jgi:hypothetical protein
MLTLKIGLMAERNTGLQRSDLDPVAAALQKQVTCDFGPIWNVKATVEALEFTRLQDVPPDYVPLIVRKNIGALGEGYHRDKGWRPYAVVKYDEGNPLWKVRASHECLEMLADPFSTFFIPGLSLDPKQGVVEYLVEVCDPCQGSEYEVDHVTVSDFCTPGFYNPVTAVTGTYTFKDKIQTPLGVTEKGFLTWYDPKGGQWWQKSGGVLEPECLGVAKRGKSPREALALRRASADQAGGFDKEGAPEHAPRKLTRRPEFYHLVYRLATDECLYQRFQAAAREVYLEYGIDIPQELLPSPVRLPSQLDLKDALRRVNASLGIARGANFGEPLPMSNCSHFP